MGMMDLFNQGDVREKLYAAAAKNNVPQGGITGKLFSSMFPHGLGNLAFGREPEPMPPLETPEGTALMADLASNMMVPGTFIGPKGLARLFGDDAAKGMLATAESKLAQGVPKEAVFQELGVFKGPEGKWRYEIDDSASFARNVPDIDINALEGSLDHSRRSISMLENRGRQMIDDGDIAGYRQNVAPMIDYMKKRVDELGVELLAAKDPTPWAAIKDNFAHGQLFSAYPEMQTVPSRYTPAMPDSSYSHNGIDIGTLSPKGATSSTLHELQHAVQEREGFARGGSPNQWEQIANDRLVDLLGKDPRLESAYGKYAALDRAIGMGEDFDPVAYESLESALLSLPNGQEVSTLHGVLSGDGRAAGSPVADDLYQRLAGEAEARAVQGRMNMSMDERRALFPEYAGRNDLIVRGLMSGL